MADNDQTRENRALDALMAAAFRISSGELVPTEEEAEELVSNPPRLSPEDEEAISSIEPGSVDHVSKKGSTPASGDQSRAVEVNHDIEEAYAAMNRGGEDSGLSEETLREIARKRRELLGEEETQADGP